MIKNFPTQWYWGAARVKGECYEAKKKKCRVALFRPTENWAKFGSVFNFFFFLFLFFTIFKKKLTISSTNLYTKCIKFLNLWYHSTQQSLVFSFYKYGSKQSIFHVFLAFFVFRNFENLDQIFKKKSNRPDPTLKFYPQKGNTTIYFFWPDVSA